jgi:broad specificity phosphatase PhoE
MGKLILIRHGHTGLNCPGQGERLRAWLDVPLDQQGLREAKTTAECLIQCPVDVIYCSDLRRARQTAEVLGKYTKAPIRATMELRPWNLGALAGQKVADVLPFLHLLSEHPELVVPSGESFDQFFTRYSRRLTALLALAYQSEKCVLAVTHVRNILASSTIINGGHRDQVAVTGGPSTGTLTVIESVDSQWRIKSDTGQRSLLQGVKFGMRSAENWRMHHNL